MITMSSARSNALSNNHVRHAALPMQGGPVWVESPAVKPVSADEWLNAWNLLQIYGRPGGAADADGQALSKRTLPERLASVLLGLSANQQGEIVGIRFQALADALGAQRETVAAILRAFRRQGLIDLGYRRIQILDVAALEELGDWPTVRLFDSAS